jgi:hypothetical protein
VGCRHKQQKSDADIRYCYLNKHKSELFKNGKEKKQTNIYIFQILLKVKNILKATKAINNDNNNNNN